MLKEAAVAEFKSKLKGELTRAHEEETGHTGAYVTVSTAVNVLAEGSDD